MTESDDPNQDQPNQDQPNQDPDYIPDIPRLFPDRPLSDRYLAAERNLLITHLDNINLFRKTYVNNPVPKQDRACTKKPAG